MGLKQEQHNLPHKKRDADYLSTRTQVKTISRTSTGAGKHTWQEGKGTEVRGETAFSK